MSVSEFVRIARKGLIPKRYSAVRSGATIRTSVWSRIISSAFYDSLTM